MRMSSFSRNRMPSALTGTACLLLAVSLAGCASKNPLIDDEPVASRTPSSTANTATASGARPDPANTAAAGPEATANNSTAAAATDGVQTSKERRFLGFLSPYRPNIAQGNFVSQEMVAKLKEGMTRDQVAFVLGTPLLRDVFHADRWDYVFRYKRGNGEVISSKVTVFFQDNRLVRYEGGNLPTEQEYLALIEGRTPAAKPASR